MKVLSAEQQRRALRALKLRTQHSGLGTEVLRCRVMVARLPVKQEVEVRFLLPQPERKGSTALSSSGRTLVSRTGNRGSNPRGAAKIVSGAMVIAGSRDVCTVESRVRIPVAPPAFAERSEGEGCHAEARSAKAGWKRKWLRLVKPNLLCTTLSSSGRTLGFQSGSRGSIPRGVARIAKYEVPLRC